MASITFDGPAKTITIGYDGAITNVDAADIYAAWKEWVLLGNAQYDPAFAESVGGNALGGGLALSSYYFLRNDLGWRILSADQNYEIRLAGDLYPQDAADDWINPAAGFTVLFVLQRSSASTFVETGVSGLTVDEAEALMLVLKILRNRRETDPDLGKQRVYDDDSTTVLLEGDLFEDVAGTQPYQGQGADRADRME